MRISVNGLENEVRAQNLESLLTELGYEEQIVATALNRDFVRAIDRLQTFLREGDAVEILRAKARG